MAKSIEQLLGIQACDLEIARIRKEMQDIPLRKAQMESALDARKARVAEAEGRLRAAQERIKRAEGEIEAARQTERKYRDQQLQIKSNDEYRALEKQIVGLKEQVSGYEDAELAAMEEADAARGEVAARKAELAEQAKTVEAEVAAYLERASGLGGELEEQEAERARRAEGADAEWLARYERIFAKQGGSAAVVPIEHGTCGHCHMKLSPSQTVEARRGDQLVPCAFCGRILYAPA